jgi:predicted acyltransferase
MSMTAPPTAGAPARAPAALVDVEMGSRPVASSATPGTRERLLALDVFRGLTIAGMLLVNDPGSWSHIYPPLRHAEWHGWTPTDLIFPFFLFIVGVTTHLSIAARRARGDDERAIRRQILRRGALIFLLGLLLNWFPFFQWGTITGNPAPTFGDRILERLENLRIMGVLQRIGLAYAAAAFLTLRTTVKQQVAILAALLFGYWFVMTLLPVPDTGLLGAFAINTKNGHLAAWLDRLVFDWRARGLGNHLWAGSVTWDPEGLLSTLPAIGTTMLGVMAGRWIAEPRPLAERLNGLFATGALGMMAGLMWNWSFPINKSIWTSSYVIFTAGVACVTLATIMWIVDVHGWRRWTKFFVIYGLNPIVAFVGSGILARLLYSILKVNYEGQRVSVVEAIYRTFVSWGLEPVNASLAFALSFVLLWFGILWVLYRRRIFLKV